MIVPARARSPDFLRVQGASQRFEGVIRDLCALGKVREGARHAEPRASQSAASSPKALAPKAPIHPFCRCRPRSRPDLRARDAREREGAERAFLREMGVRDAARTMGGRSRLQRVLNGESALTAWNRGQPKAYRVVTLGDKIAACAAPRGIGLKQPAVHRAPSGGVPDVQIIGSPADIQSHALYRAAKTGDIEAARAFVAEVVSDDDIARFEANLGARRPILVGVAAVEAGSVNEIPQAMADRFSAKLGLAVADDIIQVNRVGHTGASGWVRLANQAAFDGPVTPGAEYWLFDDFVGQGGTFANLRGHIESRGGRVMGLTALAGRADSAKLGLSSETLGALRTKHGNLENWWREQFGFGFEALTESEARYLLRAEDADTIRNRLAEAAQQGRAR